jgi:alpha-glucosidase
MLFALLVSLKGTTLIYQGEELGLPQAALPRHLLRDPVGDLYWPYDGGRDGCRTPMPWTEGPQMGFTAGEPWLPLAAEHRGLSVEAQQADPDSTLNFAKAVIGLRRAEPALRLGGIEFLETDAPLIAFIRRHADAAGSASIACVFNLSDAPQVLASPALAGAELLWLRSGEADLRGESVGLSPYGAAFLRIR